MKRFSIVFFILFSMLFCFGQEYKTFIGIDAGPSIASIRNKDNSDLKFKTGYALGISYEYFMNETFGIKSGLMFERKGAKDQLNKIDSEGNPTGKQDIDIQYDYLVVPVLFAYHTPGSVSFYANAGPYFGVLLKNMIYYEENDQYPGFREDFTSETNALDFGLSIGLGMNAELTDTFLLGADIKNNLGLTKTIGSSKNNSLTLLLGLKYRL